MVHIARDGGYCLYLDLWAVEYEKECDGIIDAWVCVEDPEDPLGAFDTNGDCRINLTDFAEFALAWLKCQRVPDTACSN